MRARVAAFITIGLLLCAASMDAHHSFAAEYDGTKPIKVAGTLTKVAWANPHIWFYLDVKDETGKVTNWGFSAAPPGVLMRRGITKDVLKLGAVIHVEGFRARDGSNNASGGVVTFPDGRRVFTASAEDAVPKNDNK